MYPTVNNFSHRLRRNTSSMAKKLIAPLIAACIAFGLVFAPISTVYALSDTCLLYTSPSPRDQRGSRMPSSA